MIKHKEKKINRNQDNNRFMKGIIMIIKQDCMDKLIM